MDNCAYFFTGVLAGVAGITLLAVLDNKYGVLSGKTKAHNDDHETHVIEVRANKKPSTVEPKLNEPNNDKNENTDTDAAVVAA